MSTEGPSAAGEIHMALYSLARALGNFTYRYSSEVRLHESLAQVLEDHRYQYTREHVLDAKNRADFFMASGLVIEVKVDGSVSEALRQVSRYIHLPQVKGVLLASTERWAARPLVKRPAWEGKPFGMVRLLRQAL